MFSCVGFWGCDGTVRAIDGIQGKNLYLFLVTWLHVLWKSRNLRLPRGEILLPKRWQLNQKGQRNLEQRQKVVGDVVSPLFFLLRVVCSAVGPLCRLLWNAPVLCHVSFLCQELCEQHQVPWPCLRLQRCSPSFHGELHPARLPLRIKREFAFHLSLT